MKLTFALLALLLAGCASPLGKLDLKDGETGCLSLNSLVYGKASMVVARADNVSKTHTNKGDLAIVCGDATMKILTDTGVPVPPGATTTTTTVVQPVKPAP